MAAGLLFFTFTLLLLSTLLLAAAAYDRDLYNSAKRLFHETSPFWLFVQHMREKAERERIMTQDRALRAA